MVKLKQQAKILQGIRSFFDNLNFIEVQTPILIKSPAPEENIEPIKAGRGFLITSPELQMKCILAQGYSNIYQICPVFRANEIGHLHSEEFRMLEWYRNGGSQYDLFDDCQNLIQFLLRHLQLPNQLQYQGLDIDFTLPWPRLSVKDAFEKYAGWNPEDKPDSERFYFDLVDKVEPNLPTNRPLFLTDYPAKFASLARLNPKNTKVAERFELYIGGIEIANAYGELCDSTEQLKRFRQESLLIKKQGRTPPSIDKNFINALDEIEKAAGIAVGIERLMMVLLDIEDISNLRDRATL